MEQFERSVVQEEVLTRRCLIEIHEVGVVFFNEITVLVLKLQKELKFLLLLALLPSQ